MGTLKPYNKRLLRHTPATLTMVEPIAGFQRLGYRSQGTGWLHASHENEGKLMLHGSRMVWACAVSGPTRSAVALSLQDENEPVEKYRARPVFCRVSIEAAAADH
jgi:hypothetical protein